MSFIYKPTGKATAKRTFENVQRNYVSKIVEKFEDRSVLHQKHGKKKFEKLTKADKREWRDAIQRAIDAVRNRTVRRALSGVVPRGKTSHRIERLSKLEEELIYQLRSDSFDLQSGLTPVVTGAASAVVAAAGALACLQVSSAAVKGVQETTDVVKELGIRSGRVLDSVERAVESTSSKTDTLLTSLTNSYASFIEKVKEFGAIVWKPAVIALTIWILTRFAHVHVVVAAIAASAAAFLPELKDLIAKYVPRSFRFQSGATSLTADIVTMILTCWVPGKDVKSVSGEFMKRVSNFSRASEGIEAFVSKVLGLCEKLVNFVLQRKGEDRISFKGKMTAYDEWRVEVLVMLEKMAKNPKLPIEEIRIAKDLQIRGFGFYQILVTNESKRDLAYWMEKLSLALSPHEGAIATENNLRPMPYCIMIGGASGVGKTTLVRLIGSIILMLSGECTPQNALENLWQKGTTEYWNGYMGQKCLVMDDCFQVKGKPGDMDSEAMQMIRAIGNWSYPLNFADLQSKGKMYLDTPLVIGTTNCLNVAAEWTPFITEPKALVRRFQTAVWVELEDQYKDDNGRFDYDRVNRMLREAVSDLAKLAAERKSEGKRLSEDDVLSKLPWGIWKLHPHGFDRENVSDMVLPDGLRGVVEHAARQIRKRKEGNASEVADMKSLLEIIGEAMEPAPVQVQSGLRSYQITVEADDHTMVRIEELVAQIQEANKKGYTRWTLVAGEVMSSAEAARRAEQNHESIMEKIENAILAWAEWVMDTNPLLHHLKMMTTGMILSMVFYAVWKVVVCLIKGVITAVCSIITTVLELFGLKSKQDTVEMQSNVKEQPKQAEPKHMDIPSFNFTGSLRTQVGVPPDEAVHDHVYHGTVKCYARDTSIGQFIGLGADVYMYPKHFRKSIEQHLKPDEMLVFKSARHGLMGEITVRAFLALRHRDLPDYDISAVAFGGVFLKATRNLVKYFLTQREIVSILRGGNTSVRLDVASLDKDFNLKRIIHTSPTCSYYASGFDKETGVTVRGLVRYTASTVAGDCGAPLTLSESRHFGGRCILGMHSAGRDNTHAREGFSTIVTQEVARELFNSLHSYIDEGVNQLEEQCPLPEGEALFGLQSALDCKGITTGSFELVGKLQKPVNMPTKTSLKPSQFQKDRVFGPSPSAPAVLRAKFVGDELVEPMAKGLGAYQTPLKCKSVDEMEPIVNLAMQPHWEATQHHPRSVLTFEEAIVPPTHWKMKPINRKTAAGYKYASFVSPQTPGKTAFLGHEGDVDFSSENKPLQKVREDVDEIITKAKQGIRLLHLCTDFLKDELRPMHKVESVATRVISGTPFDYTIAVRMYFGAFMAAMFDTYVQNGMAPGINHYKEWFMIAESLAEVGQDTFDGDFSRFDSSEMPWLHMPLLDYINKWYRHNNSEWSPEDDRVRFVLWMELVHSRHITGFGNALQYVVQWNKSLPSGHPLTTVVNSMYSLVTLTGCYVHSTGDYVDMWQHVRLCTFGDDNVNSVSVEKRDLFNQVTVARDMMALFDLTYTAGDKSGQLIPYKTIDEVTFLKRSFVRDDDVAGLISCNVNVGWVAPLAKESFLYEPYWYKNTRDPALDLVTRIEHCLCEMALHGQEVWDEYVPRLLEWCTQKGVNVKLTSRHAARQFVKTRFDVWF